jgi:general stress protein 26
LEHEDARRLYKIREHAARKKHADQATKDMIWREGYDRYYKLGVTDPDYYVLHFTAESGRFYENSGSTDFKVK